MPLQICLWPSLGEIGAEREDTGSQDWPHSLYILNSWVSKQNLQKPCLPLLEMLTIEASQENIGSIQKSLGLRALKPLRYKYWEVYKEPSPLPQTVIHRNPGEGASSLCCPLGTKVTEIPGNRMILK